MGSHSSALSVNEFADRFQRLPGGGTVADITDIPIAYGLPRDEGSRLPSVVPELDDAPLYDHGRLPSVERDDLIADVTVRSFSELTSPPGDVPKRATGLLFGYVGRENNADTEYEMVPTGEIAHITENRGESLAL